MTYEIYITETIAGPVTPEKVQEALKSFPRKAELQMTTEDKNLIIESTVENVPGQLGRTIDEAFRAEQIKQAQNQRGY